MVLRANDKQLENAETSEAQLIKGGAFQFTSSWWSPGKRCRPSPDSRRVLWWEDESKHLGLRCLLPFVAFYYQVRITVSLSHY